MSNGMSYLECLLALILIFIRLSLGAFGECSSEQVSTFPEFAVYYYLLPVATYLLMKKDVCLILLFFESSIFCLRYTSTDFVKL